jgi:hypothetical protein
MMLKRMMTWFSKKLLTAITEICSITILFSCTGTVRNINIPISYIITNLHCLSRKVSCRYDVETFLAHRFVSTGEAVSFNNYLFIALCFRT